MAYTKLKFSNDIEAVDILSMQEMSVEEYREYLNGELLFVDHHDILRSGPAEYPLATNKEQLEILISYLQGLRSRVGSESI
ncbi:hypothetical protein L1F06_014305 [Ectopseudomonas hydrolytica]|uniref:Uncharacterized protein n=1 Tax=Ectopseudomonas hydrolytica TaxID=2493633 RepID=A0ABY5A2J4_9GAMM|nr:hypothetical protein [Pseudomonas hydrolytica]USR37848.1 hypothetical protein L1F06_014305 [Pseudomonas hydrolytica]